jgi:thioredoxin-dependent peroxiredoxin
MALYLGDTAPNFIAETTHGRLDFFAWKGNSWAVLFSHPGDFTPVCTTELGRAAALEAEFTRRDTKLIGLSVDPVESHLRWQEDIREVTGHAVRFPIIADPHHMVSDVYDMLHPKASDTATVRSVFIVGPANRIELILTYPASTGRSFDELLRVLDSLQLAASHPVVTPADWKPGEPVIIDPSLGDAEASAEFPIGFTRVRSYLRFTPAPEPRSEPTER